jgi:hypothetical protein
MYLYGNNSKLNLIRVIIEVVYIIGYIVYILVLI